MKPVACALQAGGISPTLIFTGQHCLRPEEFGLAGYPRLHLDCPGQPEPHSHVRAVTHLMLPLLAASRPDLLLVQGDTSSALGGALAGFSAGVPVGHVEAGLRTHDPLLPWPEEEYRTAIDADADLLFAPTNLSAANLVAEKVRGEIHVTGNTSTDAVLEAERLLPPSSRHGDSTSRILVTCHRRESWGEGLESIAAAIRDLASMERTSIDFVLHPNSFVKSKMQELLGGFSGVSLLQPCTHYELLSRISGADLVLSDSGGIQEEAPTLGVPLLILRDKTERPECVAAGAAVLVGTDAVRILSEAQAVLGDSDRRSQMSRRTLPFGDGRAGERIATIIIDWLAQRSLTRRLA